MAQLLKTKLGKKLQTIRNKAIKKGMRLLSVTEIRNLRKEY